MADEQQVVPAPLRFRTRAREVEAIQFTGENIAEVVKFLEPFGGPYRPSQATASRPISVMDTDCFVHDLRPYMHVLVRTGRDLRVLSYDAFMCDFEPVMEGQQPEPEPKPEPTPEPKPVSEKTRKAAAAEKP